MGKLAKFKRPLIGKIFMLFGLKDFGGEDDFLELPMSAEDHARALRYRRLALAETDRAKAEVLNRIADEAERGVLCTVDRLKTILKAPPSALPYGRGLGGW